MAISVTATALKIRHPYGYRSDDIRADGGRAYRRLRYNAARAPLAALILDVTYGSSPLTVTATLGNTYDRNAEAMSYSLDWDNGDAPDAGTIGPAVTETKALTATAAAAELLVDGQPSDADTVTIDDGEGNVVTFEFESGGGVTAGNVSVTIGIDANATASNLAAAIDGSALNIAAAVDAVTANQVNLTHESTGDDTNDAAITNAGVNPPTVQAAFAGGQSTFDVELTVIDASANSVTDTVRVVTV